MKVYVIVVCLLASCCAMAHQAIDLAGGWRFRLDSGNKGIEERWFATDLPDRVKLPGSTDENRVGIPNTRPPDFNYLSRLFEYTGAAWYQRDIEVPADWKDKRVSIFLERCHWETQVWIDDRPQGMQDSLCTPHVFPVRESLTQGKHRLTIRVDNSIKYDVGKDAHSITEQTQTNWNGIIGKIELRAADSVHMGAVRVFPDLANETASVEIELVNATGTLVNGVLNIAASSVEGAEESMQSGLSVSLPAGNTRRSFELPMKGCVKPWDEFSPALHEITVSLTARQDNTILTDMAKTTFGMRDLRVQDKRLTLNGRPIFLRGTLDCCIYPLTGYPPTDVESWLRVIRTAKSYGLNHLRFHSWCPPEAAFAAADLYGFLFHVEAPQWVFDVGKVPARDEFIQAEMLRILDTYGNHPSFGMFCMGNELQGDPAFLQSLVRLGKEHDARHLYTSSTAWAWGGGDEYNVAAQPRGLHGPTTDADFREYDAHSKVPIISHEIGQWTVFPNLEEIPKYTGVLKPRNFELVRDGLRAHGLLELAPHYTRATGLFMVQLYKEEIESQLRTPGHGGFQLLDLHDFPGQGTALVGTLDPFWDSKGFIEPQQFRRFCGPTVPLLRLKKRTFTVDESLSAAVEVANYGAAFTAPAIYRITDEHGGEVARIEKPPCDFKTGVTTPLPSLELGADALAKAPAPARLNITVELAGTPFANDWNVWLYPAAADVAVSQDIVVVHAWDEEAKQALDAGRSVLLLAGPDILTQSLRGSFAPVFWSPIWFKSGPQTMSILCDPKHPAFAAFPTDMQTDWQWFDLLQNSRTMILDDLPADLAPIVRVIDNFSRNSRLANLFEARVGKGRLMVCSIDLYSDLETRPVARQLLASVLAYMKGASFNPACELTAEQMAAAFGVPRAFLSMLHAPDSFDGAKLRVRAAVNAPKPEVPEPWRSNADEVVAREKGFDYSIEGGTWRDAVGAAWHSGDDLRVKIRCPKGFQGTLFAHFSDWNNLNRVAEVSFQGRLLGVISQYNGEGKWVAVPVTKEDSAQGALVLSARPSQANVMITQVLLK